MEKRSKIVCSASGFLDKRASRREWKRYVKPNSPQPEKQI